jgi:small subunit ribosomal protein S6
MLQRYETLYIAVPEITKDEAGSVEKELTKAVKDAKGGVISFERWGKYHLAYPVRNNEYGVYYLMRFEVDNEQKAEVLQALKNLYRVRFNDLVMRNIIVHLPSEGSLEYKRPESLEEAPSKDIDVIMKESKTLLKTNNSHENGDNFESDFEMAEE